MNDEIRATARIILVCSLTQCLRCTLVPQFQDLVWDGSERGDALLLQSMIHLGLDLLQARDPKIFTSTLDGYDVQVSITSTFP